MECTCHSNVASVYTSNVVVVMLVTLLNMCKGFEVDYV